MMYRILPPTMLALALAAAGCASSGPEQEPTRTDGMPGFDDRQGMQTSGQSDRETLDPNALDPTLKQIPRQRKLHFAFDQAGIEPQYQELLKQHADYLRDNPDTRVRIEGHADERGTREYNMGLGERRALTVQKNLLLMGVRAEQLTPLSYGEEKPEVIGDSETSYRQNRRVELNYGSAVSRRAPVQPSTDEEPPVGDPDRDGDFAVR